MAMSFAQLTIQDRSSGEASKWRLLWESHGEGKLEAHEGEKIRSPRAKSTGVSLESGELGRGDKMLVPSQLRSWEARQETDSRVRGWSRGTGKLLAQGREATRTNLGAKERSESSGHRRSPW